jgi:hypothetical protein
MILTVHGGLGVRTARTTCEKEGRITWGISTHVHERKNVIYTRVSGVWDRSLQPGEAETLCGVSRLAGSFTHGRSLRVLTPGVSGLTGVSGL